MSPVVLYTSTVCPYCHAAKRLFDSVGVTYDEVALDHKPELRRRPSDENQGARTRRLGQGSGSQGVVHARDADPAGL